MEENVVANTIFFQRGAFPVPPTLISQPLPRQRFSPTSFMQRQTELGKRGFQPSKASNFGQEFSPITACAEGPVPEKSHRPTRAVSPETLPIADAVRGLAIDLIVPQNLFVPLSSWEGAPILYATAQSEYQ